MLQTNEEIDRKQKNAIIFEQKIADLNEQILEFDLEFDNQKKEINTLDEKLKVSDSNNKHLENEILKFRMKINTTNEVQLIFTIYKL